MDAPTPEFIVSSGATLSLNCERCRLLTQPPDLLQKLCAAGRGAVPVDQLRFRCHRCGQPGEPWVTGEGNTHPA